MIYRHFTVKKQRGKNSPPFVNSEFPGGAFLANSAFRIKPVGGSDPSRRTAVLPPSPHPDTIPRDGDQIAELTLVPMTFRGISEFVYGFSTHAGVCPLPLSLHSYLNSAGNRNVFVRRVLQTDQRRPRIPLWIAMVSNRRTGLPLVLFADGGGAGFVLR